MGPPEQPAAVTGPASSAMGTPETLTGPAIIAKLLDGARAAACNRGSSSSSSRGGQQPSDGPATAAAPEQRPGGWISTPQCRSLARRILSSPAAGPGALRDAVRSVITSLPSTLSALGSSSGSDGNSSDCHDLVGASVMLVQLLCSVGDANGKNNGQNENRDAGNGRPNGAAVGKVSPPLADAELAKMSMELVSAVCKSVSSAVRGSVSPGDSSTGSSSGADAADAAVRSSRRRELGLLAFDSVFRSVNPLVEARAYLLAPVWRGLCDVASALGSGAGVEAGVGGGAIGGGAACIALSLGDTLADAAGALLAYIGEGAAQIASVVVRPLTATGGKVVGNFESNNRQDNHQAQQLRTVRQSDKQVRQQSKMMIFLLARLGTIAPLWLHRSSPSSLFGATAGTGRWSQSQQQVLTVLAEAVTNLRGLTVISDLISERLASSARTAAANSEEDVVDGVRLVLDTVRQIGPKVDQLVAKILWADPPKAGTAGGGGPICRRSLQALLSVMGGEAVTAAEAGDALSRPSLALGKLALLRSLLRKLLTTVDPTAAARSTADSDADGGADDLDTNADASLSICEDLLFLTLPLCHPYLTESASLLASSDGAKDSAHDLTGRSTLVEIIDLVSDCTLRCELRLPGDGQQPGTMPSPSPSAVRMHGVLARWLAPAKVDRCGPASADSAVATTGGDRGTSRLLHPLSREVVIAVVHLHVLRLCRSSSVAATTGVGAHGEVSAYHLASLLSKLLLDPRTGTEGRQNVAAAILRLLGKHRPGRNDTASTNPAAGRGEGTTTRELALRSLFDECKSRPRMMARGSDQKHRRAGRKRRSAANGEQRSLFGAARDWSPQDIRAVGSVLENMASVEAFWSQLDATMSADLRQSCADVQLGSTRNGGKKMRSWPIGRRSPAPLGLTLYCLTGALKSSLLVEEGGTRISADKVTRFKERSTVDLYGLHSELAHLLSMSLKGGMSHGTIEEKSHVNTQHHMETLLPALFRFIHFFMLRHGQTYPSTELGTICASLASSVQSIGGRNGEQGFTISISPAIMYEISSLLSNIGIVVSSSCSSDVLKEISSAFHGLFQSKEWSIVATTMASLEKFASTLPANHQSILPRFLPAECQPLLQCRFKGEIYDVRRGVTIPRDWRHGKELRLNHGEDDELLITGSAVSRARWRKLHVRASDIVIQSNSTVLTLSQAGIGVGGAILILPPGSDMSAIGRDLASIVAWGCKKGVLSRAVPTTDRSNCILQIDEHS